MTDGLSLQLHRAPPRGGRKILVLLFTLFALPFVIVAGLHLLDWRPARSGNHGEIVSGAPALPLASLHDPEEQPVGALAGRWMLVVAVPGACTEHCRERLDLMRRLHVALNKNQPRVRRLLLSPAPGADPALPAIRAAWPDLVVARSDDARWQALLAAIPAGEVRVVVLDPEGRPVLRYADNFDARRALRDIDRLLKLSWIG